MITFQNFLFFITLLFSGLVAGLLFSYSCSVNPALKTLPDDAYIKTMQSVNAVIQNPLFFTCFLGILILFPLACRQVFIHQNSSCFYFLLTAAICYYAGVFGITILGNVPLNEKLAIFSTGTSSAAEISAMRRSYEQSWNTLHTLRTVAAVTSFALTIIALTKINLIYADH